MFHKNLKSSFLHDSEVSLHYWLLWSTVRRSNCCGGGCSEAKWCSSKAQGSVQVCSNQATITWDSTHDIFPATNIIFQYSSAFMIIVTTAVLRQVRLLRNSSKQQSISTIYSCHQVRDTFLIFFICHISNNCVCFSEFLRVS